MGDAGVERLVEEQIKYYRARAPEYDEWFERRGQYDFGPDEHRKWDEEVGALEAAVRRAAPRGRVLELACGTGWWTERLADAAELLVAVDASPEALQLNRQRLSPRPHVHYVRADLFRWEPARRFGTVFFSFWLSHVPPERFESFWSLVDRSLEADGHVVLVDSAPSVEQVTQQVRRLETRHEHGDGTVTRQLNDGRTFRIVKIYYTPTQLQTRLENLGWTFHFDTTPSFYVAHGHRR